MKSSELNIFMQNFIHQEGLGKYPMIVSGPKKTKYLLASFDPETKEFIVPHVKFQIDRIEVKVPTMLGIDVWIRSYYPHYPQTKKGDEVRLRIESICS